LRPEGIDVSFGDEVVQRVWGKGRTASPNDPNMWRKDECGAWIRRSEYGNRNSEFGWEIDHISPEGGDNLSNLRPLQWNNNATKREGRLKCPVIAKGTTNVER